VLDPSHDDNTDTTHRARTTAIGVIPAGATVPVQFTPLEEFTSNNFRIVGVSFLAKEKMTYNIPSDFVMSSTASGLIVQEEEDDGGRSYYEGADPFFFRSLWGRNSNKRGDEKRMSMLFSSSADEEDR
jgi:hypothetical protein